MLFRLNGGLAVFVYFFQKGHLELPFAWLPLAAPIIIVEVRNSTILTVLREPFSGSGDE